MGGKWGQKSVARAPRIQARVLYFFGSGLALRVGLDDCAKMPRPSISAELLPKG